MLVADLSQSADIKVLSTARLYQVLEDLDALDQPSPSLAVVRGLADQASVEAVVRGSYARVGEVFRIAKTLGVEEIQGRKTVTRSQMTDLRTGGSTVLDYSSVEYDIGLDEKLFTERYLRAAPAELLD